MKNFPLGFVSEDALERVGQSWAAQYAGVKTTAHREFRIKADALATHSDAIETHKWFLCEKLGRDVGFHVAAADYFENVSPNVASTCAMRMAAVWRSGIRKLLALNMNFDGPNSLLNFERAMRGTQSLAR